MPRTPSSDVELTDVTLRDGLQMEAQVPLAMKLALLEKLLPCGYQRYEITSFVHPKWVPQFSDSENLCKELENRPGPWMAFVPNTKGVQRSLPFSIPWLSCFIAASETFNQKNVNQSIDETLAELKSLVKEAHKHSRKIRIYVSTVFGCPYEGDIPIANLLGLLKKVVDLEPDEIALSDTIGVALPSQVKNILNEFLKLYPLERTALHLHNTYGLALGCVDAAYEVGVRKFDGSTGGIGGCPYAKGATGNVALEDVVFTLFRRKAVGSYKEKEIRSALDFMKKNMQLKIYSQAFEIFEKGGALYGVK